MKVTGEMIEHGCRAICSFERLDPDERVTYSGTRTYVKPPLLQWEMYKNEVRVALEAVLTAPPPPDRVQPERVEACVHVHRWADGADGGQYCVSCPAKREPLPAPPTDASGGVTAKLACALRARIGDAPPTHFEQDALEAADRARKPDTRAQAASAEQTTNLGGIDFSLVVDGEYGPGKKLVKSQAASAGEPVAWRTIDSAPKTGIALLMYQEWKSGHPCIFIGHYANGWVLSESIHDEDLIDEFPTHWMPLPKSPTPSENAADAINYLSTGLPAPTDGRSTNDGGYREVTLEDAIAARRKYLFGMGDLSIDHNTVMHDALLSIHAVIRCPAGEKL